MESRQVSANLGVVLKDYFYDDVTTKEFNAAYVAHIVASDPSGPRGDNELSHKLSNKLENLMLMCGKHHALIDDPSTGKRIFLWNFLKK